MCCLASLITGELFYFAFLLILIVQLSETVAGIAFCCFRNGDKLIWAFLMMIILVNTFSFRIWSNYSDHFTKLHHTQHACETYISCFLNVLNLGMFLDGGIGTALEAVYDLESHEFLNKFLLDVTFFLFLNILLFGIFFGIIVDAFHGYRKQALMREKDATTICFTCGMKQDDLKKRNIDFEAHLKFHEIWKYMFYIQYLTILQVNDYNGTDIYVSDLLKNHQLSWLPLKTET